MAIRLDPFSLRATEYAYKRLKFLAANHQPLHAVLDDTLKEHENLLEEVMKYKSTNLPEELVERLKKRQHPRQTVAGVIEELLEAVEQLEDKTPKPLQDSPITTKP